MESKVFHRQYYLNRIRGFYHSDLIKVITGIRRCGKSYFMLSIIEDLIAQGVNKKDIIYLNLDLKEYLDVDNVKKLDKLIELNIVDDDYKYLFIDEIQNVKNFETLINAYRETNKISIFITGSNSYLLSGELVTKLTGRYIEIQMFTLNFFEFMEMKKFLNKTISQNKTLEFQEYLQYGGFPKILEFDREIDKQQYAKDVVYQIFEKDIKKYKKIKNWSVFERVLIYMINNFGATTNITNILDYFHNIEHIPIKQETLYNYIKMLENAKILNKCQRFDIKSRKSLRGDQKYYLADLSIYTSINTDNRINYGPVLENIIYNYLVSKQYQVSVGRIGNFECDFITRYQQDYSYVQVAMSIADKQTEDREYNSLEKIRDNNPKYLFTLDSLLQKRNGIKHLNLIDFISSDKDL